MVGDIDTARNPDLVVALHVIKEARQRCSACWPPDQAAMQADRQHLRLAQSMRVTFAIQYVENVLQVVEELGAGIEKLKPCIAAKRMSFVSSV